MSKILITGGAGFIGSALIRYIIEKQEDTIINVDSLTYAGNLESLDIIENSSRYFFEEVDICNSCELDRVINQYQPDSIMHLAAESHVDRSIDGPSDFIQTNIIGTFTLLESARKYLSSRDESFREQFRFHHISTDEVYGDLENISDLFTESTPYNPSSPYSASKASSDHLVRAWQRTYGVPIIVTNCSNNYGPYQFPEKLIPHMLTSALKGKPLPIYGEGDQIRDWLYVEDHAKALYLVVKKGLVGETYNIGGHNEKQNIDVVKMICDILDEIVPEKPKGIRTFHQLITFVDDRPGHDKRYAINANKMENELGWKPEQTFESGIRKTVEWYLKNPIWWERVLTGEYKLSRIGKGK